MEYELPDVPDQLHVTGRRAFEDICHEYEVSDLDDIRMVTLYAEALDRAAQARRRIRNEGLVIKDRFDQLRPHPAVAIETKARQQAASILATFQRSQIALQRLKLAVSRHERAQERAASPPARRGGGTRRFGT